MLTKTFSDKPNSPQRTKLWACILCNQLAFPGLGTIIAGRPIGYAQAAVMLAGFALFTGFMLWFFVCVARHISGGISDAAEFSAQWHRYFWAAKYGLSLCLLAWLWSLFSSIWIFRQLQKDALNPPRH